MGAVSFSATTGNRRDGVTADGLRFVEVDVTPSASYTTGGDSVSLGAIGLMEVEEVWVLAAAIRGLEVDHGAALTNDGGVSVAFDLASRTAPKMKLFTAAATEAANASDQSAATNTVRVRFCGH